MQNPEEKMDECYALHKQFWGHRHHARVVDQLIEEMAELTKELMKQRRGFSGRILDELSDVLICLLFVGQDEAGDHDVGEEIEERMMETVRRLSSDLRQWMDTAPEHRPAQYR
jgi:NTP pyrophosphatase (non-canonical NTP hydrolase)